MLVLGRYEAGGGVGKTEPGQHHQPGIQEQGDTAATNNPAYGADVAMAGLDEEAVEGTEQPAAEDLVEHLGEAILRRIMTAQQHGGEGRGQGQRVEGGNHRRDRDGQRELLIELPGQAADKGRRNEHRTQHQRRGDDRAGHFAHGLFSGLEGLQPQLDITLDVLHHHDGVVHHDTDRQYQAEQRQCVKREAKQVHHRKRTDQRYRHRHQRNDRGAPGLQEQNHHQHHQDQCFEQGVHHRFDGATHEDGRVIDDAVVHPLREVLFQLFHLAAHFVGDLDGVGARALEDRDRHRRLVVEQRTQGILARTQLDPCDVLQAGDFTVIACANNDVLELFLRHQTALSVHRQLEAGGIRRRLRTEGTGGHLAVLLADRIDYISGGQVARRGLVRVQPYTQGVVAHAEQLHITHAAQACQLILHIEQGVVGQVEHVVTLIR